MGTYGYIVWASNATDRFTELTDISHNECLRLWSRYDESRRLSLYQILVTSYVSSCFKAIYCLLFQSLQKPLRSRIHTRYAGRDKRNGLVEDDPLNIYAASSPVNRCERTGRVKVLNYRYGTWASYMRRTGSSIDYHDQRENSEKTGISQLVVGRYYSITVETVHFFVFL